ncbi:c-type cytochrome [Lishizhenia sp.]|uniref:c-type cytochrome n=1 Tax=Lishizhenia sp. TaxID=2497594 RepID=UPI00299E3FA4|nr:c-type cytochrome [Lishizhenia sp.]MDX1447231.1 diheme cytochrome c-553 [Lishizhenia sp.]
MKTTRFYMIGLLLLFLALQTACTDYAASKDNQEETDVAALQDDSDAVIKRGEYLVMTMGCHDCHSPKKMGPMGPEVIPELMLSGHHGEDLSPVFDSIKLPPGFAVMFPDLTAAAGPWGISYAANLTPDETGIKYWTEEQFGKALKEGKSKGLDDTRMLLPPMPWMNFKDLADEDLHALFTYLQSIPPVENLVPLPKVNMPPIE